jgi:hypothetical protein
MSDLFAVLSILEGPLIIIAFAVSAFLLKKKVKKMMEARLGRRVEDRELVSISSWMNAPDVLSTRVEGKR